MRRFHIVCLVAVSLLALAQVPSAQSQSAADQQAASALPVRRVVLYKTGVGYFEHLGNVRNDENVAVRFTSAQLNDVLNSLTVLDLGSGQISGISYNSVAPLEQRLGALRLPLDSTTTQVRMLGTLRGARVEVSSSTGRVQGRLLSVEQRQMQRGNGSEHVDQISIVTDNGEMRTFGLSPAVQVRLLDRDLRQEVGRYLDLVGSAREQDVRSMLISTSGTGERPLFVSYISEVPIWKSTYRLVLSPTGKPLLQGWAIVDNTIGEDWTDVELSLVAGAPQSFIQNISQPYFGRRPVVPMPSTLLVAPQTHQATLGDGAGTVRGIVRDSSGQALPGATVRLLGPTGIAATAISGADGRYQLTAPAGTYSLRIELQGFQPRIQNNWSLQAGAVTDYNVNLAVGSLSETVAVTGESPLRRESGGLAGGSFGGRPVPPPAPAAPMPAQVYDRAMALESQANAGVLGDLFAYKIKEPITLTKNQSALVPILSASIDAEKVSLWNRPSGSGRPLLAVWLANSTGLTLDAGTMSLVDAGAFGGEGLLEPIKPGEKRLVSYGMDLGVNVASDRQNGKERTVRLRARDGIFIQEKVERMTTAYRARNENAEPTTLIVEHRLQPGWKLADGQTPVESTADAQRFRIVLPTAKESVLEIREIRQVESSLFLSEMNTQTIEALTATGISVAVIEKAMKPVFDKRGELAGIDRRLETLGKEAVAIAADQLRVRENLKALKGSPEERALVQRYTRQLDQQESRLEVLKSQATSATGEREKVLAELNALMAAVTFDEIVP